MPNVIRVGDPTSPGGKVLESGARHFKVSGLPVAVVGDKCFCSIQGHQTCTIASGDFRHTVNGKPVAYKGDKSGDGPEGWVIRTLRTKVMTIKADTTTAR